MAKLIEGFFGYKPENIAAEKPLYVNERLTTNGERYRTTTKT
jgi:hypothetical protein